jgi:hypothetical protein
MAELSSASKSRVGWIRWSSVRIRSSGSSGPRLGPPLRRRRVSILTGPIDAALRVSKWPVQPQSAPKASRSPGLAWSSQPCTWAALPPVMQLCSEPVALGKLAAWLLRDAGVGRLSVASRNVARAAELAAAGTGGGSARHRRSARTDQAARRRRTGPAARPAPGTPASSNGPRRPPPPPHPPQDLAPADCPRQAVPQPARMIPSTSTRCASSLISARTPTALMPARRPFLILAALEENAAAHDTLGKRLDSLDPIADDLTAGHLNHSIGGRDHVACVAAVDCRHDRRAR